MWELLTFLTWIVVIIGAVAAAAWGVKLYLSGGFTVGKLLTPARERRLDVVDHANVDGKRRLLLVRRDNVEHLIMTGGPVDVVIETGINGQPVASANFNRAPAAKAPIEPSSSETVSEPVFSRPARTFQKAVGEK